MRLTNRCRKQGHLHCHSRSLNLLSTTAALTLTRCFRPQISLVSLRAETLAVARHYDFQDPPTLQATICGCSTKTKRLQNNLENAGYFGIPEDESWLQRRICQRGRQGLMTFDEERDACADAAEARVRELEAELERCSGG